MKQPNQAATGTHSKDFDMAVLAQTIQEGRDHVLRRIGAPGSSDYEALCLTMLNHALSYVTSFRDWNFMRKKATVSTTDTTGTLIMPDDLNRILALYKTGEEILLTRLDPLPFCQAKEDSGIDEPIFFCEIESTQDTSVEAPHVNVEIYKAPASGTTYELWYIKNLDEWVTADLATVPLLPPFIWHLVLRHTTYDMLKQVESDSTKVQLEHQSFVEAITLAAKQEDAGSSHFESIGTLPSSVVRKNRRFRR